MKVHPFSIVPKVPDLLSPLKEIMFNLWWSWNPEAVDLFRRIDHEMWSKTGHNPVAMLGMVSQQRLRELAQDPPFIAHMERMSEALKEYLDTAPKTPMTDGEECDLDGTCLAYFSMEYAIHECLPIYAGGLGALAGDHVKSASDLGLPLVAVGLLYRQGHYHQYLSYDGWQKEVYLENDFHNMPLTLVRGDDGEPVVIEVKIQEETVRLRAWMVKVGRVPLYLLDANMDENTPGMREITSRLYAPGAAIRLQQEIVLGIGGVRFLQKIGKAPSIFHMNEGHSAFLALERARITMAEFGLTFEEAIEAIRAGNIFTTHTPVQAGIDHFPADLIKAQLGQELIQMGIPMEGVMRLGLSDPSQGQADLSMAVLAIRTSIYRNGVSRLHGVVARKMWADVWRGTPVDEVPIGHVTNGIHVRTWLSDEMARLYFRYLGPQWMNETNSEKTWERIHEIPDNELWRAKERLKQRLIGYVRKNLPKHLARRGCAQSEVCTGEQVLDPEALTIGFARRFASYKRAALIFREPERLYKILGDKDRPAQIVFAGKAHPADDEGKKLIQQIIRFCRQREFRDRVVFVEDYDINIARYLVQGVDVWLNTPRRPLEACGTSGMKVIPNGGLHLSVLDGWWDEAYTNEVGWAIGNGEEQGDLETQDQLDSYDIYEVLEQDIIPLFYDRLEEEVPIAWVKKMKRAMATLIPVFNTDRMVSEYAEKYYKPAIKYRRRIGAENYRAAMHLAKWKKKVQTAWPNVAVTRVEELSRKETPIGEPLEISCTVALGGLENDDVRVEAYYGPLDNSGEISSPKSHPLHFDLKKDNGEVVFSGTILGEEVGRNGFAIRVRPTHPNLVNEPDSGLVIWG
jgi:starch phosphorylase